MTAQQEPLKTISLTPRGRALFVGMTGSGKSELKMRLVNHWVATRAKPRVLILDSKPRFRAEWELNGLSAAKRYKKWQRGPVVPNSFALDFKHGGSIRAQLKQVWQLHGNIAIAQTASQHELPLLREAAHWFYHDANDRYSQLLDVDELADFFGTTGYAATGDDLLKVVRSGREMNVSFAGAAQRPKGLPHSFLTEVSDLYLFHIASLKDMVHLEDMGLPGDATPPEQDHVFYLYRRKTRQGHKYILDLGPQEPQGESPA